MRMMVLNRDPAHPFLRKGVARAPIIGVEIVGDDPRLDVKYGFQVADGHLEELALSYILQVPDMLADKSILAFRQTHSILQFSADGQRRD